MNQPSDGSDIKKFYTGLANQAFNAIKQTTIELDFFRNIYQKELFTDKNSSLTLEIIKNLEVIYEQEKAEYYRLKNISVSGVISPEQS